MNTKTRLLLMTVVALGLSAVTSLSYSISSSIGKKVPVKEVETIGDSLRQQVQKSNISSKYEWEGAKQFSSSCEPICIDRYTLQVPGGCVIGRAVNKTYVNCMAQGRICHERGCIEPCRDTDGLGPDDERALLYGGTVTYYDAEEDTVKREVDHCKMMDMTSHMQGTVIYEYGCKQGVSPFSDDLIESEMKECPEGKRCYAGGPIVSSLTNGRPARCVSDGDGDGIPNECNGDNCPDVANPDQADADGDGIGDACEADYGDRDNDNDGINDYADNCLGTANPDQADTDSDCWGDMCDNCKLSINPDQSDMDRDGVGDVCDNCPVTANADQIDEDRDGVGDLCCIVEFEDAGLEEVILSKLGKEEGPVLCSEAARITSLSIRHCDSSNSFDSRFCLRDYEYEAELRSLAGIEHCINLQELSLRNQQYLGDISPLAGLTNLTKLHIDSSQITDIAALSNLTGLEWLELSDNQITDIPLSNLVNLAYLTLGNNRITTITALSNLTGLIWLSLSNNQITDITPLSNLVNLGYLSLSYNQIINIPLSNLINLEYLSLHNNRLANIAPLSNLVNLKELYLDHNQIRDISPFVSGSALGSGNTVTLYSNPLSYDSINIYIPALTARGVDVRY